MRLPRHIVTTGSRWTSQLAGCACTERRWCSRRSASATACPSPTYDTVHAEVIEPVQYEIRIEGVLDERWSCWFDGMQITTQQPGVRAIKGRVAEQAPLHGLIARLRDLGIPLISVRRLDAD